MSWVVECDGGWAREKLCVSGKRGRSVCGRVR